MTKTAARGARPPRDLAVASLLVWQDLADRFGVSTRTIRNDIDRLREPGYPIEGTQGKADGYRLRSGAKLSGTSTAPTR